MYFIKDAKTQYEKLNYEVFPRGSNKTSGDEQSYYQQQKEFQDNSPKYYNDFEQYIRPPEPELLVPVIKKILSNTQVQKMRKEKLIISKKIQDTLKKFQRNKQEEANLVSFYNSGSMNESTYKNKSSKVKKEFQELETMNKSFEEQLQKIDSMIEIGS
jgi:hypothetical protein